MLKVKNLLKILLRLWEWVTSIDVWNHIPLESFTKDYYVSNDKPDTETEMMCPIIV